MKAAAQPYASALVDVAVKQGSAEEWKKQLAVLAALMDESADLRNFLTNPAVERMQKHGVVVRLVARLGFSEAIRNLLYVLIDNRRVTLLPAVRDAFEALLNARLGVVEAHVTSANELSASEKTGMAKALSYLTGKRVETRYITDTELIGGAIVRIGSTVYDGSVRRRLDSLLAKLAGE